MHADDEPSSLTPGEARWKYRPIVVASVVDEALEKQLKLLNAAAEALRERDVRVIALQMEQGGKIKRATVDGQPLDARAAAAWLDKVTMGKTGIGVSLIGKDGGIKKESYTPVPAEDFIALIDTMPMRQEEAAKDQ